MIVLDPQLDPRELEVRLGFLYRCTYSYLSRLHVAYSLVSHGAVPSGDWEHKYTCVCPA